MILNCPLCSGVVMKTEAEEVTNFSCSLRCPHCKRNFRCIIRTEIVVTMTEIEKDGRPRSDPVKLENLGKTNIRTI